jgi:sorting nexin-1/2
MATAGEGGAPVPDVFIETSEGRLRVTREEGAYFEAVFLIVDSDEDGMVDGSSGASFLRRSNLPNDTLRAIWQGASGGRSVPALGRSQFFVALKLVAMAQADGRCAVSALMDGAVYPLPDFGLNERVSALALEEATEGERELSPEEFSVAVRAPEVVGSGLTKYTRYTVSSVNTLASLPHKEAHVSRRYSDFAWLSDRLSERFPGTILPPLPEKRAVGNTDAEFVEERRLALEHYANKVARHPRLSRAFELQIFLNASPAGLAAAKALAVDPRLRRSSLGVPSAASIASTLGDWFSSAKKSVGLEAERPPVFVDKEDEAAYNKISASLVGYEARLGGAVNAAEGSMRTEKGRAYELLRVGHYWGAIGSIERGPGGMEGAALFHAALCAALERAGDVSHDACDASTALFLTPLRYQLGRVGSVKAVLRNRERALGDMEAAERSLSRRKKAYAQARAASSGGGRSATGVGDSSAGIGEATERIRAGCACAA